MKRETLKPAMIFFAGIIILLLTLKLLHFDFSYSLLLLKIAFGGLLLSNLIFNLSKKKKKLTDYLIVLYIVSLIILWISVKYELPIKKNMMMTAGIISLMWFINLYHTILNFKEKKERINNYLFITAAVVFTFGALFKVQHWPMGNELFYTGLTLAILSILIEFRSWIKK